jgi:hypothetical protein
MMPLTLIGSQSVATSGLVDSGAAVNVLPYAMGVQLGFDWDQQTRSVELSGNLASVEARVVVLSAVVGRRKEGEKVTATKSGEYRVEKEAKRGYVQFIPHSWPPKLDVPPRRIPFFARPEA